MSLGRNQTAFDRLSIYEKVKILEGENFVTVEDTKALSPAELQSFIEHFIEDLAFDAIPNINILINSKFPPEVDVVLSKNGFTLHDEVINVFKSLEGIILDNEPYFTFKSIGEITVQEFMDVWRAAMAESPNAPTSLTMDEQMRSVEKELGPGYRDSCIGAYENNNPIGVVMPHIEPGTFDEGRLFYFGLLPEERGKGKSKPLHRQALAVLQDYFEASYYIGSTSKKNTPMLRTFEASGCAITEENKLYKKLLCLTKNYK
ncbi:GNAT family N-acetyltransferase [Virgibacillus kekensis]|uniref:GNAT family N-acetyltransferase n=1 Tax=Virgibacillus kekensis TaxID=202261 RepID=A0ABV9DJA8_9BACI